METPISRLHQDMRDMWNDAPKNDKKKIIQENQIEEILINDGRKVRIKYSKYAQFGEFNISLPLRVEIITNTFSIQINHKDDILLNGKHIVKNH